MSFSENDCSTSVFVSGGYMCARKRWTFCKDKEATLVSPETGDTQNKVPFGGAYRYCSG